MHTEAFLFEVGFEELPPLYLPATRRAFVALVKQAFSKQQLQYQSLEFFSTPRRLAVLVKGLQTKQPAAISFYQGPLYEKAFEASKHPTKAASSFLAAHTHSNPLPAQLPTVSRAAVLALRHKSFSSQSQEAEALPDGPCRIVDEKTKLAFLGMKKTTAALEVKVLLPQLLLEEIVLRLTFPKTMHWGKTYVLQGKTQAEAEVHPPPVSLHSAGPLRFARPVRFGVALLGNENIFAPLTLKKVGEDQSKNSVYELHRNGVPTSEFSNPHCLPLVELFRRAESRGHFLLHRDPSSKRERPLKILSAAAYEATLTKAYVIPNREKRIRQIKQQLQTLEEKHCVRALGGVGGKNALLETVCDLVEFPNLLFSKFNPAFLQLPREVLVSELVEHQKYLPLEQLREQQAALFPGFIITANLPGSAAALEKVRAGNERVLAARLTDGLFLYKADLKQGLSNMAKQLSKIVFHKRLGSYFDKIERLKLLLSAMWQSLERHPTFSQLNFKLLEKIAPLLKADLVSRMVNEFPSLQGIMGEYYALYERVPTAYAQAIRDHYLPLPSNKMLPRSKAGSLLCLADHLDSLVSLFVAEEKPLQGKLDPHGLRRHASAIVRLLVEQTLPLELRALITTASATLLKKGLAKQSPLEELVVLLRARQETLFLTLFKEQRLQKSTLHAILRRAGGVRLVPYEDFILLEVTLQVLASATAAAELQALGLSSRRLKKIISKAAPPSQSPAALEKWSVDEGALEEKAERELYSHYQTLAAEQLRLEKLLFTHPQSRLLEKYRSTFFSLFRYNSLLERFFEAVLVKVPQQKKRLNRLALLRCVRQQITFFISAEELALSASKEKLKT